MRYALFLLLAALPVWSGGCSNQELAQNLQIPTFTEFTGPPSPVSDYALKTTTATVDVHGWVNSDVFLRYALNDPDILRTLEATEITNVCEVEGSIRTCAHDFPKGTDGGAPVHSPGTTVYYQWFVEYRLPEGEDAAYVETDVRSFTINALGQSCVDNSDCGSGLVCRRDESQADPITTLAPLRCQEPVGG